MAFRVKASGFKTPGFKTLGGLALMAGLLAGCAQSPQYLNVEPQVTTAVPRAGSGQAVTLATVDGRDSDVLGTRSGKRMATDTITVPAHTLMPRLQQQAQQALQRMGFAPTEATAEGRPSLTLTLAQLSYEKADAKPLLDKARLIARVQAVARNGGTTYTGVYTAKREQTYALKPDTRENNQMVSELLTNALNRAFSDPAIGELLAR
ncbi:YajG family lipoprotein [Modicisalibacter sp. 'Wilcox']|uniref:YajG family lipoprotein n=1 Tax=Modicisalibacter sp. 'Wilcox' TaxID=2679914 RepID=UPI0013D05E8A|nr:YajG family lipoprotein [Modicisalibacter sp. 'Wilcox']